MTNSSTLQRLSVVVVIMVALSVLNTFLADTGSGDASWTGQGQDRPSRHIIQLTTTMFPVVMVVEAFLPSPTTITVLPIIRSRYPSVRSTGDRNNNDCAKNDRLGRIRSSSSSSSSLLLSSLRAISHPQEKQQYNTNKLSLSSSSSSSLHSLTKGKNGINSIGRKNVGTVVVWATTALTTDGPTSTIISTTTSEEANIGITSNKNDDDDNNNNNNRGNNNNNEGIPSSKRRDVPLEVTSVEEFERYWYGVGEDEEEGIDTRLHHHHHHQQQSSSSSSLFKSSSGSEMGGGNNERVRQNNNSQKNKKKTKRRNYPSLLKGLYIKGDTQIIGSKDHPDFIHPVVQLLHERRRRRRRCQTQGEEEVEQQRPTESSTEELFSGSASSNDTTQTSTTTANINNDNNKSNAALNNNNHDDGNKVALVIEGGGMRGCVSAGMVCAIHHLGLEDTVDVVYGSSAGAVVAAYFVSRQVPWFGPEVYYDELTNAGNNFIDWKRLLRCLGFGLADPRLLKDVLTRPRDGKPLLNVRYLTETIMQGTKPLDWESFQTRQKTQPLKVIATGLESQRPYVLDQEGGHFDTLQDLCASLHASCLLPGVAGPVMNVLRKHRQHRSRTEETDEIERFLMMDDQYHAENTKDQQPKESEGPDANSNKRKKPTFVIQNALNDPDYEPLGDAMLSSPIPYDVAYADGATHVVVLRSSPDGTNLMAGTATKSIWESLIFRRFFMRKNRLPKTFKRIQTNQDHQRIYAKSILELNERARPQSTTKTSSYDSTSMTRTTAEEASVSTMTIALEPGTVEVSHLETSRRVIFDGVRSGFARAYDALVEDPALRGLGTAVAKEYFPDEILDYDPERVITSGQMNRDDGGNSIEQQQQQEQKQDFSSQLLISSFEKYMQISNVSPKAWNKKGGRPLN